MHIVHIITRFIRGGADENTLITCNGQAEIGHNVTLICGHEYDQEMLDSLDSRVNIVILETLTREIRPLIDIKCYLELIRYFKKNKPDIVHTHESKAGILGRLAANFEDVSLIVHGVHILAFMNANKFKRAIYIFLERLAGYCTHAFLHVSPAMQEQCKRNNIGHKALHKVIPSGMDLSRFREATPSSFSNVDHNNTNSIPSSTKFLIMSGTLEERKRVKEFLSIFKNIVSKYPDVMLLVAGDGSERVAIEEEATNLSIRDKLIMLGYTSQIEEYIARADIGIHAALHEGLPRVVLQYLASGKPVAVTYLEGIDYVVKNDTNGYIVDELYELEKKILSMLTDEGVYTHLADGAKATDLSKWNHQNMIDNIEASYIEISKKMKKNYISL